MAGGGARPARAHPGEAPLAHLLPQQRPQPAAGAGAFGAAAITLRLGGGPGWAGLGADAGVAARPPHGIFGPLAQWLLDRLVKLPVVGGLAHRVGVQSFAGMLLAAVVVAAALLLGRLWSVWTVTTRPVLPARRGPRDLADRLAALGLPRADRGRW